jgi:hypothetical protein
MINKYIELHGQFIELLAEYHNAHLRFIRKPSYYSSVNLVKSTTKLKKFIRVLRNNITETRLQLLKDKKERIVSQKLKKQQRKQHGTDNKQDEGTA